MAQKAASSGEDPSLGARPASTASVSTAGLTLTCFEM